MKRTLIILSAMMLSSLVVTTSFAQRISRSSTYLLPVAKGSVPLIFKSNADIKDYNIPAQPVEWGLDVAWNWDLNVIRGTNAITKDVLNIGRVSFQPSIMKDDKTLSDWQINNLNSRLKNIALSGVKDIVLNCDHEVLCNKESYPEADANYANYYGKPQNWFNVIKATAEYCNHNGFNVVAVSPFNEPDYTAWKEGTQAHFKEIARLIREDSFFDNIRICGGNTLNCDQALSWYNYLKPYVNEGNTHQLAGTMANYIKFWDTVRNDGNHATADELHNTMEAFIGIHHGMQTGIWWGWDGIARGEFCQASHYGKEIGYAEDAGTWTGGAVYRWNNKTAAFIGTSERQAKPQTYNIISSDRLAYFDGEGPMYAYPKHVPGDPNGKYQGSQTNAEAMVGITYGEDVPTDYIRSGTYVIMNAKSKYALSYTLTSSLIQQIYYRRYPMSYNQWKIETVAENCGGDFSYSTLRTPDTTDKKCLTTAEEYGLESGKYLENRIDWANPGRNHFFFEYAGDNYWYIRNRYTGLYLQPLKGGTNQETPIVMQEFTGNEEQKWRFIPVNTTTLSNTGKLEVDAPAAPTDVLVTKQPASAIIKWTPNTTDTDVDGYCILRAKNGSNEWDMIGRMVKENTFIDNDITEGDTYIYKVKTVDRSRNISLASAASSPVSFLRPAAAVNRRGDIVAHYPLNVNLNDTTCNQNDAVITGTMLLGTPAKGKMEGTSALHLNGTNFLTLPPAVGAMKEMTICMWVYNDSFTINWTRLFDFGNDQDHYFFLTPGNGSEMRLVMKNGGNEEILSAIKLGTGRTYGWQHIAVTLAADSVTLYVNDKAYTSRSMKIRPSDFKPKLNYIGASQFAADPLFNGYIDDVRIYNYALSNAELAQLRALKELPTGDANRDGKVTVADANMVINYAVNKVEGDIDLDASDMDLDGNVTEADAKAITDKYLTE